MKISTTTPVLAVAGACALGLLAGLYVPDAEAASSRSRYFRPSGICEAPLPVYDRYLRKAPMMVANTSNQQVFVSCAVPTDPVGDLGDAWLTIHVSSTAAVARQLTCTMITGTADGPVYDADTRSISPGSNTWFTWSSVNKRTAEGLVSMQCTLPPGVQLTSIYFSESDSAGGI